MSERKRKTRQGLVFSNLFWKNKFYFLKLALGRLVRSRQGPEGLALFSWGESETLPHPRGGEGLVFSNLFWKNKFYFLKLEAEPTKIFILLTKLLLTLASSLFLANSFLNVSEDIFNKLAASVKLSTIISWLDIFKK